MYYRLFQQRIRDLAKLFPALVLTGPRQAGKTTLLRQVFADYHYVTLDIPSVAEAAELDPSSFFRDHPPPVLIDEVQYAPGLFRHLKTLVDKDRELLGRFILTGSQSFPLMKSVSDSLAGRCVWLELENLAWAEITSGVEPEQPPDWIKLLVRGQFPELWKRPELPTQEYLGSYFATYLERDVRQILNVTSLRDFERFIRLLAARSGALLNKTELAKDSGMSTRAIGDWLAVLESSGQIILLEPWFRNFGKRIIRSPKVYFRDSGLLCFLLGIDEISLPKSSFLGAIWEGFVFAELRKLGAARSKKGRWWFYRDQFGQEIDFLYEHDGLLDFLEVKWTESPQERDMQAIKKIRAALAASDNPERPGQSWLVSRAPACWQSEDGTGMIHPGRLAKVLVGKV